MGALRSESRGAELVGGVPVLVEAGENGWKFDMLKIELRPRAIIANDRGRSPTRRMVGASMVSVGLIASDIGRSCL